MSKKMDDFEIVPIEDAPIVQPERVDRSATALAAAAKASIQARVWLAVERPRQLPRVRDVILSQVKRPSLASKAVYRIERGRKKNEATGEWETNYVEGPSIKLANALRIAMGNMGTEDRVLADDGDYRTIEVVAMDYESNSSESRTVVVSKTIERRGTKKGGKEYPPDREIISSRKNSYGETVYKVVATEAEIQEAQNSAAARARRNTILALIPADLVEDAIKLAKQVASSTIAQQRQATIDKIKNAFSRMGVSQQELANYLDRSIDDATADDLAGIEMLLTAISDGQTTWKATLAARLEARADDEEPTKEPAPTDDKKGSGALKSAIDKKVKE